MTLFASLMEARVCVCGHCFLLRDRHLTTHTGTHTGVTFSLKMMTGGRFSMGVRIFYIFYNFSMGVTLLC